MRELAERVAKNLLVRDRWALPFLRLAPIVAGLLARSSLSFGRALLSISLGPFASARGLTVFSQKFRGPVEN